MEVTGNFYDAHLDSAWEHDEAEMDACPPRTERPSVDAMASKLIAEHRWPLAYTSRRILDAERWNLGDGDYWQAVESRIIELKENAA